MTIENILSTASYSLLAIVLLMTIIVIVNGKTAKIIETLGKPRKKALMPGLSFKLPWPIEVVVGSVNLQLVESRIEVSVKTKDDSFVELPVTVQYRASSDPEEAVRAHYELENAENQISSYVLNTVKTTASAMTMQELYNNKDNIEKSVKNDLDVFLAEAGYSIVNVLVDEPRPDESVIEASNKVIASQRLKEAARNDAEAEKIRMIGRATADAESKKLQGKGMADMRREMAKGVSESIAAIEKSGVSPAEAIEMFNEVNRQDSIVSAAHGGNLILMDLNKNNADIGKLIAANGGKPSRKDDKPDVSSMSSDKSRNADDKANDTQEAVA